MGRMACLDLPAFPLQLLLQRHPDWRPCPVAVVDRDRPQGKILWVNERARSFGVLPGMRYAAGLSLTGLLRAGEVSAKQIERSVTALVRRLRRFTPGVEPSDDDPGVFWLDASGLELLHDSLGQWAALIRADLEHRGFRCNMVVGFGRFGTYALAKAKRGVIVLERPADEQAAARRVPLERLALEPEVRDALDKLGVRSVGQFVGLPEDGVERRFGDAVRRLHRLAAGALPLPLQPARPHPPAVQRMILDHPEAAVQRLLRMLERLLEPLLQELAGRGQALAQVHVGFRFERLGEHVERVRPAAPTLDGAQVLELIRLRLEALRRLPDGVTELCLAADGVAATPDQSRLFAARPRRDLAAANRALARLRAELGERSVVRARLREGHLPEGGFAWEPLERLSVPRPRQLESRKLVRRVYTRPVTLPSRPRHEPDGWMLRDLAQGPVVKVQGPYVVSGGWWRKRVHREYHFAETQRGELLWVYYDRLRRRWYLQGRVE